MKNITFDNSKIRNRKSVAWITMEGTDLCQPVIYEENGSCSSVFKEKNRVSEKITIKTRLSFTSPEFYRREVAF